MTILFVLHRLAHVRHFDRAIRLLADRGYRVVLASQEDDERVSDVLLDHPSITVTRAPHRRGDDWAEASKALRRTRDFVRYLHPRYAEALLLRKRAFTKMIGGVSGREEAVSPDFGELLLAMNPSEQRKLDAILAKLESAIPVDPDVHAFMTTERPALLVVSPLVGIGFSQADFIKSARQLGIPSGLLVFSWDNLSNKGLLHEMPDRMWVWNDTQRDEAEALHKFPASRVVVTGAPRFDPFFEMQPAIARDALCQALGFDAARPIVCYLCSSRFVAGQEQTFVRRWLAELRRSQAPVLAGANVIVRPHPAGVKDWHVEPRTVVRWPGREKASASKPFDDPGVAVMHSAMQNADQVLWDTVYHSAAVVGLNTSAEIEAAIVGRPVFTILDPDAPGQTGTLHFSYLLREQGGHVQLGRDFDEHRAQLSRALAGDDDRAAREAFLQRFVRPHGLGVPVSPRLADAIAALANAQSPGASEVVSTP